MSAPWRIERDGPLAVLVLDAGPLNLFDEAVIDGLEAALGDLEAGDQRGVLFRAEGKVVSGGVDVAVFDALGGPQDAAAFFTRIIRFAERFEALPVPTVSALHGLCLTAAFELSLAGDLILAAESARCGLVETVVGLTPAMGGTQRFAERAGAARAREFVMTGDLYDAQTLSDWGVVNRVLPDAGFQEAAHAFAMRLAQGPTQAHAATKRIVRTQQQAGARAADALTPQLAGELFATEDLQQAVRSFLEQGPGKATFSGR
jgi:enoyl-CoA hydratase